MRLSRQGDGSSRKGILAWVEDVAYWLACVFVVVMMAAIFADVAGRYLFGNPIVGTREVVTRYLMVGTIWFSVARTQRLGGHVAIDLVMRKVPKRAEVPVSILVKLASAVPMGLIAWASYPAMVDTWGTYTLGVVEIPVAPSWGMVVLGSGLLALRLLVSAGGDVVQVFRTALGKPVRTASTNSGEGS